MLNDINQQTLKDAEVVFNALGMNLTTGIEIYLTRVIRSEAIPFSLDATDASEKSLLEIVREKNIPIVKLEVNEKGQIIVDKDKHPEIYDWAENG
ncbi:MAG: hypothetical protein FWB93_00095 [Oscillospiraceae bacterium]|nr:hypothetical protein [Oscillospiraceae bacterium]